MLHICLAIFILYTKVHLIISCVKVQLIHFVIHFHLVHLRDHIEHLVHIHHIWFCSYCILFEPHSLFACYFIKITTQHLPIALPLNQIQDILLGITIDRDSKFDDHVKHLMFLLALRLS